MGLVHANLIAREAVDARLLLPDGRDGKMQEVKLLWDKLLGAKSVDVGREVVDRLAHLCIVQGFNSRLYGLLGPQERDVVGDLSCYSCSTLETFDPFQGCVFLGSF